MSDRLPPEIAALLPNGDQLEVADLTPYDVRHVFAAITSVLRATRAELTQGLSFGQVAASRRVLERYRAALNKIACWDEGPVVTGSFDEPGSARTAREALSELPPASDNPVVPVEGAQVDGPQG